MLTEDRYTVSEVALGRHGLSKPQMSRPTGQGSGFPLNRDLDMCGRIALVLIRIGRSWRPAL